MPGLDDTIFGECQALLFNFESLLVQEFSDKYALYESLSFSLQFSIQRNAAQEQSRRSLRKAVAKDVKRYVEEFRSSLSTEQLNDLEFSYKVFLIPKLANQERSADLAVEFVKYDPTNVEEVNRIERAIALIKPTSLSIQGFATLGVGTIPSVRITSDPNAPGVRGISAEDTCNMRQMDVLRRLLEILGTTERITSHDLQCVRKAHRVDEHPEWFWKPHFSAPQYSEAYAQWLATQFRENANFFWDARQAL